MASLASTCPIPASSGNTVRYRLNRGGDPPQSGPDHPRHYQAKLDAIVAQQRAGIVDPDLDPRHLLLALISLAAYWLLQPQFVRLVLGDRRAAARLVTERIGVSALDSSF